jgi:hypothetical protein
MTRVIVHPVQQGAPDGAAWAAYIEGHEDPFWLATLSELNGRIRELGTDRPAYYGAGGAACDSRLCLLAATATVLWSPPGEIAARRACDDHQQAYRDQAAQWPSAVLGEFVARLPKARMHLASGPDMILLTRALIGCEVPAEVLAQPACTRCQEKICASPMARDLQWVTGRGSPRCGRRKTGHAPSPDGVVPVIIRWYQLASGNDDARLPMAAGG